MKAKRILMLTSDDKIDRRILLQMSSLTDVGFDVDIITKQVVQSHLIEQQNINAANVINVIYRRLQQSKFINRLLRPVKSIFCLLFGSPAHFYSKLYFPYIATLQADIIVAHDLPMLIAGVISAKRLGAKLVYDSHELFAEQEFTSLEKLMWRRVERKYINYCDLVMTINTSIANELQQRYSLTNVGVVQNAEKLSVDDHPKNLLHDILSLPSSVKIILYQGNLSPMRNLEVMIKVLAQLQDESLHVLYLGSGSCEEYLKSLALQYQLTERVHFIPAVAQQDLLKYTACADLGVIPYLPICLNNALCTPNKLFEYIAAGIPVMSHDLVEIKKLTSRYNMGVVSDFTSTEKIANSLRQLNTTKGLWHDLKQAALAAREKINWQEESKILLSLYGDLTKC